MRQWPDFEAALLGGFLVGTIAAALLASENGFAPLQRPLTFGLVFWGWCVLFSAAAALPFVLAIWLVTRVSGVSRLPQLCFGALMLVVLGAVFACSSHAVGALATLEGPGRYRWLCPAAFVLSVLAVLALALQPPHRRRPARLLAALGGAAFLGAFLPPSAANATLAAVPVASRAIARQRFLLVGVDGASWDYLGPLVERGALPHFAALQSRGAWGRLKSFAPTVSPVIWTSIATGKKPEEHGIQGFMDLRIRGVHAALPRLHGPERMGFARFYQLLRDAGQAFESPVASTSRTVPAYWNIASSYGAPVDVVNWWATWPAEPILGNMVSELPFNRPRDPAPGAGVTYPETLYHEISRLVVTRHQVTLEQAGRFMDVTPEELQAMKGPTSALKGIQWLAHFLALFETTRGISLHLLEKDRTRSDLLVLFGLVDMTSHTALRYSELVSDHLGASSEELRKFAGTVGEAYRAVDRALGELMDAFGDGNVLVISDHGFALQGDARGPAYGHDVSPDGILLAAGPAFRHANVDGVTVYDVLPLLLYLKGFPVATDLAGRMPEELFDPAFVSANPLLRVGSYGRRDRLALGGAAGIVDEEARRRLRALGYIN